MFRGLYHSFMTRRLRSIPALVLGAILLTALVPVWLPSALLADLLRGRRRLPTVRLLAFAVAWAWIETAGVGVAGVLWLIGRGRHLPSHYGLQRWWAARLIGALRVTCGVRVVVENPEALRPGPTLLLARHASLADSLVSAYAISTHSQVNPRYVLKKELLADPCLDIVGNRLPNHFLDRGATDSAPELAALERLVADLGPDGVGVIFPEGTRANPKKRASALDKIGSIDPERAARLGSMQHLLPPRPAGAAALLRGNPEADVVLAWHVGFEGFDTFGGILRGVGDPPAPVRFVMKRVARSEVPAATEANMKVFTEWLDRQWLDLDAQVGRALDERSRHG